MSSIQPIVTRVEPTMTSLRAKLNGGAAAEFAAPAPDAPAAEAYKAL